MQMSNVFPADSQNIFSQIIYEKKQQQVANNNLQVVESNNHEKHISEQESYKQTKNNSHS